MMAPRPVSAWILLVVCTRIVSSLVVMTQADRPVMTQADGPVMTQADRPVMTQADCPVHCTCDQPSGFVNCSRLSLTQLPTLPVWTRYSVTCYSIFSGLFGINESFR